MYNYYKIYVEVILRYQKWRAEPGLAPPRQAAEGRQPP